MFRIVRSSNFDKDWYNEEFVNLPLMHEEQAGYICSYLNLIVCPVDSEHIYRVVPKDYQLYIGMVA